MPPGGVEDSYSPTATVSPGDERARRRTAKTTRDGVRVARRAGRTGAEGRVLDRGGGRVSPAPLWWETWGQEWRG